MGGNSQVSILVIQAIYISNSKIVVICRVLIDSNWYYNPALQIGACPSSDPLLLEGFCIKEVMCKVQ